MSDALPLSGQLIAQTDGSFCDFAPYVASVNAEGVVAFQAGLMAAEGEETGVFCGRPGEVHRCSVDGSDVTGFFSHPDIDARGDLSCYASVRGGKDAVVLWQGGRWQNIAVSGGDFLRIGPLGPTMNAHGLVAFRADWKTGESGLFVGDADGTTCVVMVGERFAGFRGLPVVDDQGRVVFCADRKEGGQGIYIWDAGESVPLVRTGARFAALGAFPGANNKGEVTFSGVLVTGEKGIYKVHQDVQPSAILESTDGVFADFRGVLRNDAGASVFYATPPGGSLGVYVDTSAGVRKVIALGDACLGSTVSDLALNPVSFSATGHVVIRLKLADGRQMLALWDGLFSPEGSNEAPEKSGATSEKAPPSKEELASAERVQMGKEALTGTEEVSLHARVKERATALWSERGISRSS